MKIRILYLSMFILFSIKNFSQNLKLENLKKDYNLERSKSGFFLLKDKNDSNKIKIANPNGDIIYTHSNTKNKTFFSAIQCDKFYIGKSVGSADDGGGFTIFEYEDVKIYDLKNPEIGTEINFKFADRSGQQLFGIYKIFDANNKVGLLNSCGQVLVPTKYNRISNFNKIGQALAYTDTDYTVLDTLGNSILKQPFIHGQKISKYSLEFYDDIADNRIQASKDGKLFGVYDFKLNKELIPYVYDEIANLSNSDFKVIAGILDDKLGYYAVKNKIISIIDYSNFKEILPQSLGANGFQSLKKINGNYFIDFYKTKNISGAASQNNSMDFHNIYFNGKVLFDSKLEIEKIEILRNRFITLQLHNKSSMIYDLEKFKFIATFPNDLIKISDVYPSSFSSKNKQNLVTNFENHFLVSYSNENKAVSNSIFDINGQAKTKPLKGNSYFMIQVDKLQDSFFYLVAFESNFYLFNNKAEPILENFKILDNENEFAYFVKDNILILNEKIEDSFVYGKTAFDINGKMIGERYRYISDPSINQEVKNNKSKPDSESVKNNRFLKK